MTLDSTSVQPPKYLRVALQSAFAAALFLGFPAVLALLLTIFIFDQLGIRVGGEVPLAISKVTMVSLMMSALAGGGALLRGVDKLLTKSLGIPAYLVDTPLRGRGEGFADVQHFEADTSAGVNEKRPRNRMVEGWSTTP